MDYNFSYAPLNGREDVLEILAKYEGELARKLGEDIVLIAYTKKDET